MAQALAEAQRENRINPVLLPVMANRMDAVCREMTNTMLLAARSSVIGMARDFSCAVITSDNQVLAVAEGFPIHVWGTNIQTKSMQDLHPDYAEGDAYLHNDPYLGNTHPADHTILVPVFHEGEHFFTVAVKAHQADVGNSLPTTYMAQAADVYQEGALIFPCVQVQRDFQTSTTSSACASAASACPSSGTATISPPSARPASASARSRPSSPSTAPTRCATSPRNGSTIPNAAASRPSVRCPRASSRARWRTTRSSPGCRRGSRST